MLRTSMVMGKKIGAVWNVSPAIEFEAVIGLNIIKPHFSQKGDEVFWSDKDKIVGALMSLDVNHWWSGTVCAKQDVRISPQEARKMAIFFQ